MKFFFWFFQCCILPLGIFMGEKNKKRLWKNRSFQNSMIKNRRSKFHDRKRNQLFSNRSIENDRSSIFDRNHYCWQDQFPTTCKIQFWYIGLTEGPVLHSIAFSDASRCGTKKKDDEIWLIGSWDLGVLFQKVLPAGHNAGQVIIKGSYKKCVTKVAKTQKARRFKNFLQKTIWNNFNLG